MLNYILANTLYKVVLPSGEEHIGTIDNVSNYFGPEPVTLTRMPVCHQAKELKPFLSDLEKYEQKNGKIYIEDFYKIWDN